jgi:hypothetical protein
VRFFVHAKNRDAVLRHAPAWVRDCLLPVSFAPEWGSVELVRAALALIAAALAADDAVQWLLLASESCLPVTSLDAAMASLHASGRSWLHYDLARSRFDVDRERRLRGGGAGGAAVCKADQWFCLTRAHARAVLDRGDFWSTFACISASDEWYFATCLALAGDISLDALRAQDRVAKERQRREELYGVCVRACTDAVAPEVDAGSATGTVRAALLCARCCVHTFVLPVVRSGAAQADALRLVHDVQPLPAVLGVWCRRRCRSSRARLLVRA